MTVRLLWQYVRMFVGCVCVCVCVCLCVCVVFECVCVYIIYAYLSLVGVHRPAVSRTANIALPKETYCYAKRGLLLCQKRPAVMPKEAYRPAVLRTANIAAHAAGGHRGCKRMCSLTAECVPLTTERILLLQNVFSYHRTCSLTPECVLLPGADQGSAAEPRSNRVLRARDVPADRPV